MNAFAPELFDARNGRQLINDAGGNQNFPRELGAIIVKCDTKAVLRFTSDVDHFLF